MPKSKTESMSEEVEKRRQELQIVSDQVAGTYTPEQIGVIQKQVAKGASTVELAYFLNVCKSVGLSPFNKEIWAYKDKQQNLIIFTGRDGLLRKAQEHPEFAGMRSSEVRENDQFTMNIPAGKIDHSYGLKDRGQIVGAYAIVFRKTGEAAIEFAYMADHKPGNVSPYAPWARYPQLMIRKVAEAHALKKAFGMASGVQLEGDFVQEGEEVKPLGKRNVEDKEKEQLEAYIKQAGIDDLLAIPASKFEKYPELREVYDKRYDEIENN